MPPSLSSNSSQALPTFPSSLPLGSNTKENPAETAEKKREKPEDKNPFLLYTRLIPDLTRPSVNCWSILTHTSHCMTAAATQMRVRVSPAMHPKVFLRQVPFLPPLSLFPGLRTSSESAGLRTVSQTGFGCIP